MEQDRTAVLDLREHKMLSKEQLDLIYSARAFYDWFNLMYALYSGLARSIETLTGKKGTKKNLTLCLGKETALKYCEVFRKGDKEPCEFHGDIEELKGYLDKAFDAKDEAVKIHIIDEMVCKMFKKGIKLFEPLPEEEVTDLMRQNVLE